MKRSVVSAFLIFLFVALGTAMFYLSDGGVSAGSIELEWKYLIGLFLFAVSFLIFLIRGNCEEYYILVQDMFVLILPYLATLLVSLLIWIVNFSSVRQMTRGFALCLYQIIGSFVALAYVSVFRKNALKVQLVSMALANLLVMWEGYRTVGGVNFIKDFCTLLLTFAETTPDFFKAIEVHDLTFAFGAVILYFLDRDRKKADYIWILIAVFFFLVGLKRIAVIGLVCAFAVILLGRILSKNAGKFFIFSLAAGFVVIAFLYVVAAKYGLYEYLIQQLGIDDKGRTDFDFFVDDLYAISPFYLGNGLGYIRKYLEQAYAAGLINVTALHNDYLGMYIDMGFWGFWLWIWTSWISRCRNFCRRKPRRMLFFAAAVFLYNFMTYFTDNTYYYIYINIIGFTSILLCNYDYDVLKPDNGIGG